MIIATTVPVYVYVTENEDGSAYVESVVVDDEVLNVARGELQDDQGKPLKGGDLNHARLLVAAVDNTEWPSWQFGF